MEEHIMQNQTQMFDEDIVAYVSVPYFLFDDVAPAVKQKYSDEITEIKRFYNYYERGVKFISEGSNNDYVPSDLRFRKSAMIMNKEARFLFSNPPTFNVNVDDVSGECEEENAIIQDYLDNV